jgi:hypothetical protein
MIMTGTDNQFSEILIGYSAFDKFEQGYLYNENACVITDKPQSMRKFIENAYLSVADHRIDAVKISDLLKDYGCSSGEYLLDAGALARFEEVAKLAGVKYSIEREDEWGTIPKGWGLIEIENFRVEER